ncbi:dihydroorotase [Candidatus Thiothrix anitrata]|uniref:Dihydroorotase n=1 Tax=Candidatus Thiothrix anitrata TaxID=2823902 RepID=A0ABX7X5L2_9GAMM|nr:dihydroorotase [Candidatus Thiothrix anitrata]QTR51174.1 dihydroorotase [Candidatus Thiothrix anitrata]
MPTNSLTITKPDDWHVHLRDGDMLKQVASYTARQFGRAIIMPNLKPPVTTAVMAAAYRERILQATRDYPDFEPLMTAYLTDTIDAQELRTGYSEGIFTAAKLYPANATTNSAAGVSDIKKIYPVLEVMQEIGMPLLVHGEVVSKNIDIFDREAAFIDAIMQPLLHDMPELKVVFEHITTKDAADFVEASAGNIAATITAHHLQINRNDMLVGGIKPHLYCLPVAKREVHRLALRRVATSGNGKFFLGTDSAPHAVHDKESACGCAGIFSAPNALENYVQVFDEENALDKFEAFASLNGSAFYGLPVNQGKITLQCQPQDVVSVIGEKELAISPYRAGEVLRWRISDN